MVPNERDTMSQANTTALPAISTDELARRVGEYRRMGFDRKAMPHIIYHSPWDLCPWPGCGFKIAGIDFQLENADAASYSKQLAAWWQGAGLVGRCPGCRQYVLFGFNDKRCVSDPQTAGLVVLPDGWFQKAYIL
jgi:hypothetical protein